MRVCDNNVVHIYNETDTSLGGMMIEQKMINIIFYNSKLLDGKMKTLKPCKG